MAEKTSVHLLHIGKTGGTSVKQALEQHLRTDRYVLHLHPHSVKLRDIPEKDYVIFFLRDPITRFISGFYSRQRQGQPRYLVPWRPEEKVAFEYFDTPNKLAVALSSRDEEEKSRAIKAMQSISHVRYFYYEWFESEQYFRSRLSDIFFIGFQERLAEDFELLKLKLDLPESVKLPDDDIQSHRNPAYLDKKLEDRAVENLRQWYREDYNFIFLCQKTPDLSAG